MEDPLLALTVTKDKAKLASLATSHSDGHGEITTLIRIDQGFLSWESCRN